jgi:GT2 family glycosyltransferase
MPCTLFLPDKKTRIELNTPSVAVVILNWNGRRYLQQFLPSVLATTYSNYRLIVADNASTDDSLDFLRAQYPSIEIIRLKENYGFAQGYNEALKQVEADYYVLLNSDVEVTPSWLEPLIELLEKENKVAACQPKILSWHQKTHFEYAGGAGGWIDAYGYPFARGRVIDTCEEDLGQYDDTVKIFWASGAALVIRSNVFHEVGGFDNFFFAHMEEIDLCWRIQLAGYDLYCCPDSVVYHVGGGTLPQGNPRKLFLNFRNNLIMLAKNLPLREKWWKLPYRMALDEAAATRKLLSGDASYFGPVVRANLAFVRWMFSKKRSRTNFSRKALIKLNGVFNGHLLVEFAFRHKRTFTAIVKSKTENNR